MTEHDTTAYPGRPCPGCPPHPDDDYTTKHAYLIIAARSPGALAACGHYHSEHCSDDEADARALLADLAARHGYAELRRRNLDGGYSRSTSITSGRPAALCCSAAVEGLPYDWNPRAGARCSACGDSWTLWTRPERVA